MTIRNRKGFSLVEAMIALFILVLAFSVVITTRVSSLSASAKAQRFNIVAMLAQSKLAEIETALEGQTFGEVEKNQEGKFEAPYQDYTWKIEIKEVKFPSIDFSQAASGNASEETPAQDPAESGTPGIDQIGNMVQKFLSDSIREVNLTITFPFTGAQVETPFAFYWVSMDQPMDISF
jgi:Tfp pilus assembly protein PilV